MNILSSLLPFFESPVLSLIKSLKEQTETESEKMAMVVPKEGLVVMDKESLSSASSDSHLRLQPQFPDFTIPVKVSSFFFCSFWFSLSASYEYI